jgi:hypothetical protein
MNPNDRSPSSGPRPERLKIVTPPVLNSIIIEQLDSVRPIVAKREGPVRLSRFVIQPRVERGVTINRPGAPQGGLVGQQRVTVGQARLLEATLKRAVVADASVGQIVQRNAPPIVQAERAVVVTPAAQRAQAAPVAQPPSTIISAAADVRPTKYLYIPGLAQDRFVQSPCADLESFRARISAAFGYRTKIVRGGRVMKDRCSPDPFMAGSVDSLCNIKGVTAVNCGRAFRWVMITSTERDVYTARPTSMRYFDEKRKMYTSKAFKQLGAPQDNYMAHTPGKKNPPKELAFDVQDHPQCVGSEYMAQRKPAPPDDDSQAERSEVKALEGLRDEDLLYIVGHGNQRGGTLTYKVPVPSSHVVQDGAIAEHQPGACPVPHFHYEKWYVDPLALAALLRDEGLPKSHKHIEMWMCYGAGVALPGEQTVQSYCQRLAGALGGFVYSRIKVRGVLGLTYPDLSINPALRPANLLLNRREKEGELIISTAEENNVMPNTVAHAKLYRTFAAK